MDGGPLPSSDQEKRPPLYNAEDYVIALKKFCKLTGLQMYLVDAQTSSSDMVSSGVMSNASTFVSAQNRKNSKSKKSSMAHSSSSMEEMRSGNDSEMGLRQFGTVSELLAKLKADLSLSFPSFLREFISEPNDGVTHLLDLLKAVQLSQTNITGSLNQLGSRANHVMFKRALGDEFETLLCLKVSSRNEDGALKLVEHPSGLFTVAVCVMSNYSKSRVLSLQLLARLCDMTGGHKQVSDAISMLRLRFGEPVRFKFLVGMLNSYNSPVFQIACLRFLNRFVETSKDAREKIMIQTELEEAGFDALPLKKFLLQSGTRGSELLKEELNRWSQNYIDVNELVKKLLEAERANKRLREEVAMVREKHRCSEEDRQRSLSTVDRLRECCDHLQSEIDKNFSSGSSSKNGSKSSSSLSSSSGNSDNQGTHVKMIPKPPRLMMVGSGDKTRHIETQTMVAYDEEEEEDFDDEEDDEITDEEDDEDVLMLLPSNYEKELRQHKEKMLQKRRIGSSSAKRMLSQSVAAIPPPPPPSSGGGNVSLSDDVGAGNLVTVLATDGYTCITSPVQNKNTTNSGVSNVVSNSGNQGPAPSQQKAGGSTVVGCSGDSGLSSEDSSEKSCSPSNNRSSSSASTSSSNEGILTRNYSESDKSSYSEKAETEPSKETPEDRLQDLDERDLEEGDEEEDDFDNTMYAERNVLQEEATTVEAERISIDRFRQRFLSCSSENNNNGSTLERLRKEKEVSPAPAPSRQIRKGDNNTSNNHSNNSTLQRRRSQASNNNVSTAKKICGLSFQMYIVFPKPNCLPYFHPNKSKQQVCVANCITSCIP